MTRLTWVLTALLSACALLNLWLWLGNSRYTLVATANEDGIAYKIDHRTGKVSLVIATEEEPVVAVEGKVQTKSPSETAIELAQSSYILSSGYPSTQAREVARDTLRKEKGPIRIEGWRGQKVDEDIFLVSFIYEKQDGKGKRGWVFEVLLSEEIVRAVFDDDDLERKYKSQIWELLKPAQP